MKRYRRPHASEVTPTTPIWCPACEAKHPASDFNRESRRFSGLAGICREAQRKKRQEPLEQEKNRARNKRRWADPEYRRRSLAASAARRKKLGTADLRRARQRLTAIVDRWKRQGCVDCGYADIRAIDPDHVSGEKVNHVSRLVQLCASADRIREELAKCEPRCARCHRQRTREQRLSRWRRSGERIPPSWQRRLATQDVNDAIKIALGCMDCGWSGAPRSLDWDHVRGTKVMTISEAISPEWQRYVIGHELGHWVNDDLSSLHMCGEWSWLGSKQERRATEVAARLLIPDWAVAAASDVDELARLCQVPRMLAEWRAYACQLVW